MDITDRIRKLLALAESPNENEAALAAEKAQELMLRHGIDMAAVAIEEGGAVGVGEARLEGKTDPWRRVLAQAVASSMGGTTVYLAGSHIEFFGPRDTVAGMVELYRYLEAQLVTISATATAKREERWVHGRTWRTSFLLGAVTRINRRLRERREAMAGESSDTSTALVVLKGAVDRYLEDKYPSLGRSSYRPSLDSRAYRAGSSAGSSVDLGDSRISSGRGALTA